MNGIDPSGKFNVGLTIGLSVLAILVVAFVYINYGYKKNIFKEPYISYIKNSASQNRLSPKLLAAIIATEIDAISLGDTFGDIPAARFGRNTSIGLGQVNVNTAIEYNLVGTRERGEVIRRLSDPRQNIEAAAKYLRIIADMAKPAAEAAGVNTKTDLGVDLEMYSLHGNQWDYNNDWTIIIIGSEYTSAPWDWQTTPEVYLPLYEFWGREVLGAYRKIEQKGYFND